MKTLVLIPIKPNLPSPLRQRCLEQTQKLKAAFPDKIEIVMDGRGPGDFHIHHLAQRVEHMAALRQEFITCHLKPEHTHVLCADADVFYEPDIVGKLWQYPNDIIAPMVLGEDTDTYYDVAGFIEDGKWVNHLYPHFKQPGPVVELDSVGAFYMVPANVFRLGAYYYPTPGYTEHYSVCGFAKRNGWKVLCDTRLVVYHACLEKYRERTHEV